MLMQHLLSYGELLVVQGPSGSGRSRLLRQIRDEAPPSWRVCLVEGGAAMSHDRLESALIEGLGLAIDPGGKDVVPALQRAIHDLRQGHVLPVCLIDDADGLPASSLELIAQLCRDGGGGETSALGFLLIVDSPAPDTAPPAPLVALKGKVGHVFDWSGFDQQATRDYVFHCLRSAGEAIGAQFSIAALRLVHASAAGLPGRINPLARRLLHGGTKRRQDRRAGEEDQPLRRETEGMEPPTPGDRKARGHRQTRRLGLLSLGLLLALVWWQQDRINALFDASPRGAVVGGEATSPVAEAGPADTTLAPEGPREDTGGPIEAPSGPAGGFAAGAMAPADVSGTPVEEAVVAGPEASADEPMAMVEAPMSSALPPVEGAARESGVAAQRGSERQGVDASTVSEPMIVAGMRVGDDSRATVEAPAPSIPSQQTRRKDAGRQETAVMEPYRAWLTSRSARHFTLQLIALGPADARRFVTEHGLADEAVLLPRQGPAGRQMLAVIYGDFASREAARQRAGELRHKIPGLAPWLRRFADIQAELARP